MLLEKALEINCIFSVVIYFLYDRIKRVLCYLFICSCNYLLKYRSILAYWFWLNDDFVYVHIVTFFKLQIVFCSSKKQEAKLQTFILQEKKLDVMNFPISNALFYMYHCSCVSLYISFKRQYFICNLLNIMLLYICVHKILYNIKS